MRLGLLHGHHHWPKKGPKTTFHKPEKDGDGDDDGIEQNQQETNKKP